MDNQQNNHTPTQEQQKPKKTARRKTRLERLAEAEQKLAQAQAEVDRLKAEEEKIDVEMKLKFSSWLIENITLIDLTDIDEISDENKKHPLLPILKGIFKGATAKEGFRFSEVPKDVLKWIRNKGY